MTPFGIIGHARQLQELLQDITSGNVSHAYLFSGPRHLGKWTVARWFAKELLTVDAPERRQKISDQVDRLIHPEAIQLDQLWMEDVCEDMDVIARSTNITQAHRVEKEAKLNEISVEDVRALHARFFDIGGGRYRCCLIRTVERMRDAAANAFLKILEEPPEGLVFLLTTELPSLLLPTLISRTRRIRFNRLPPEELKPRLHSIDPEDALFLLELAQGAPGVIERLRSDPDRLRAERTIAGKAKEFWEVPSLTGRIQLLSPLYERGDEADAFLLHLALALRRTAAPSWASVSALHALKRGLQTNAHRKLLTDRFAFAVT